MHVRCGTDFLGHAMRGNDQAKSNLDVPVEGKLVLGVEAIVFLLLSFVRVLGTARHLPGRYDETGTTEASVTGNTSQTRKRYVTKTEEGKHTVGESVSSLFGG